MHRVSLLIDIILREHILPVSSLQHSKWLQALVGRR